MKKIKFLLLVLLVKTSFAQKAIIFNIALEATENGLQVPVKFALKTGSNFNEKNAVLTEIATKKSVPFQIQNGIMYFQTKSDAASKSFRLAKGKAKESKPMAIVERDGKLMIQANGQDLLGYQMKILYPPAGVDTAFKRSGFIHPLVSPKGQVLTRIQPADHSHHYGIWNPWTHVLFEKDTVDFWNLYLKKGTVRFVKVLEKTVGNVFSEYKVQHDHVAFQKASEKVAMNEIQTVRVYQPDENNDYYIMDIDFELKCASESPVTILQYRYAGLGWRATQQWNNKNSEVLSSEGKNRKEADGTKARWCMVQGAVDGTNAGAVMLSNPQNFNHPEPLRIWPENMYDRGDMFAMFAPTKDTDLPLIPGKTYTFKYRWLVFNGQISKEKIEAVWKNYAKS